MLKEHIQKHLQNDVECKPSSSTNFPQEKFRNINTHTHTHPVWFGLCLCLLASPSLLNSYFIFFLIHGELFLAIQMYSPTSLQLHLPLHHFFRLVFQDLPSMYSVHSSPTVIFPELNFCLSYSLIQCPVYSRYSIKAC